MMGWRAGYVAYYDAALAPAGAGPGGPPAAGGRQHANFNGGGGGAGPAAAASAAPGALGMAQLKVLPRPV